MIGRMFRLNACVLLMVGGAAACATLPDAPSKVSPPAVANSDYRLGPGDQIQVFVWRNQELSTMVRVRPDGKISVPLIDDLPVSGKTPTETARAVEERLAEYVKGAVVSVIVTDFVGPAESQIRVIGEAAKPLALPYRQGLTVLDVMVQSGGLTPYAAGNRATITRHGEAYRVRLSDLILDGDLSANVEMLPGDVLSIPQSWF